MNKNIILSQNISSIIKNNNIKIKFLQNILKKYKLIILDKENEYNHICKELNININ